MSQVDRGGEIFYSENLVPLTEAILTDEIAGIQEDCLNWDCGHPMWDEEAAILPTAESAP